ncbi:hypothetical protein H6800_00795 [Candidatus Nomurabacteria bacterium]|nr:hypothetical protein [Candidatus Nomurabacteria bacterium]
MIKGRTTEYIERTGDNLGANVLAKATELSGSIGLATAVHFEAINTARLSVGISLVAGGLILDRLTGGLRTYRGESISD